MRRIAGCRVTLRDQIIRILNEDNPVPHSPDSVYGPIADEIMALLSEGPTPTQIEAGAQGLARWWDIEDPDKAPHDPDEADYLMAEAVLRAASEATP